MSFLLRTGFVLCLGLAACKAVDVVGDTPIVCDQDDWALCEGFDGSGRAPFEPALYGIDFHVHSAATLTGISCETSGDCTPYVEDGALFLNSEDSGYGMAVMRMERPFDFSGREGRIHYRSDLKGQPRMLQVMYLSPTLSNTLPDLRISEAIDAGPALSVTYYGGNGQPFAVIRWQDGAPAQTLLVQGDLGITRGNLYDVDIFVTRASARVLIDGESVFDAALDDLGFDRGYVYFAQVANDPAKDGFVGDEVNRIIWDELAFDGPLLPRNSLTPADKQDVLFRAWDAAACTVRGVSAQGPFTPPVLLFDTWRVRLDREAPEVLVSDISCTRYEMVTPHSGDALIGDIHVVTQ